MSAILHGLTPRADHGESIRSDQSGWARLFVGFGIVRVCALLGKEDIYKYGETCIRAFKIVEFLDTACAPNDRPQLVQHMVDTKWFRVCLWVSRLPLLPWFDVPLSTILAHRHLTPVGSLVNLPPFAVWRYVESYILITTLYSH